MATQPLFHAGPRSDPTLLVPAHSTRPRVLWTPGANGSEIRQISVASSDAANNNLQLSIGRKITLVSAMGVGALVDGGGGSDTITRTSESFITDGWVAGDRMFVVGPTTLANGFEALLTAVAAATLTFATGSVDTVENLPADSYLARLARLTYVAVPLGSGIPSVVAVTGLDVTQQPALDSSPDRYLLLGPDDILVGAATTALDTGETMDVIVSGFDF